MNRRYFRVIFSKTRQSLIVVSELAKSVAKSVAESGSLPAPNKQNICTKAKSAQLNALVFSLYCGLGLVAFSPASSAQELIIKADPSAGKNQQPILLQTANGLPQVNIQTPNDKGLSHNKYRQFDVDSRGAILNNCRTAVRTQLAGMVQANPNLAHGEARVILNEVNSSDPSILKGYVEVAGKKAEVIIANPSGLHCEGCGILNAHRATLTTGRPQIVDGRLESYVVEKGKISVAGKGLDNSRVDYTDIIAKEAQINAGIWGAKQLNLVSGQNRVKHSDSVQGVQIIHRGAEEAEKTVQKEPHFAVDVSKLGGMYAQKIYMVGTEQGLGVRNAGHIGAGSDALIIDGRGHILNKGTLSAAGNIDLNGEGELVNSGDIQTLKGAVKLKAGQNIRHNGSITARHNHINLDAGQHIIQTGETLASGDINYRAQHMDISHDATIGAGIQFRPQGQQESRSPASFSHKGNNISLQARESLKAQGKILASNLVQANGNSLDFSNTHLSANRAQLQAAQGNLSLQGAALHINQDLTLHTPAQLSTQKAKISADYLKFKAAQLNNSQGMLHSRSTKALDFNFSEGFINKQGQLATSGALNLTAADIDNYAGSLFAGHRLWLQTGDLDNRQGNISGKALLTINAKQIDNGEKAVIFSADNLNLNAQRLNNSEGSVQAAGDAQIRLEEGLNNSKVSESGSLIQAGNHLNVTAQQINNSRTKATTAAPRQGILANRLSLNAERLDNRAGGIYSGADISAGVAAALDNREGEILALGALSLAGSKLTVKNGEGKLESKGNLALNIEGFADTSQGTLKTQSNADIRLSKDLVLSGVFQADGVLNLTTQGNFYNNARLLSGKALNIHSNLVENAENGVLSALDTRVSANTINNRGLIDGAVTLLNTSGLNNLGGGRIYGDRLAITAAQLTNSQDPNKVQAATIAARQRLDLGVTRLSNRDHALIFSLGDLHIGGKLDASNYAAGKAELVDNGSATIEALGNATINTANLRNHDLHLTLAAKEQKEYIHEVATQTDSQRYRNQVEGKFNWHGRDAWFDFHDPKKATIVRKEWYGWKYNRITNTPYIERQDPGKILIGGNLTLDGDNLHNQYSKLLIGGTLQLGTKSFGANGTRPILSDGITSLHNEDLKQRIEVTDIGHSYFLKHQKKHGNHGHYEVNQSPFTLTHPTREKDFGIVQNLIGDRRAVTEASGGYQLDNLEQAPQTVLTSRNPVQPNSEIKKDAGAGQGISAPNLSIKTLSPDIRLPQASLYRINSDPAGRYLVETDPRFINSAKWLSSDYMLKALKSDARMALKRLGDGFYEQRLVNEQINQLTGRRFLSGYASDYEQYLALMDSGVRYAQHFGLIPGVALTAEQMKALTEDMVWLVSKEIRLADGTTGSVLVPQVYVVGRNTDSDNRGAVISAQRINARITGDIHNSGVISGRNLTALSARNLLNNGGTIGAERLLLNAEETLLNSGGKLRAQNLLAAQGKNIRIESSLAESRDTGDFYKKDINRQAIVEVGAKEGRLLLQAQQNIDLRAASLISAGETDIRAGARLNLDTQTTRNKEHYNADADNYYRLEQSKEIGSELKLAGNATLFAKQGINMRAAQLSGNGNLNIISAGDISLAEGREREQLSTARKWNSRNLTSRTSSINLYRHDYDLAKGTQIEANNILLHSQGGNISLRGSDAVAENRMQILAKNIDINAAENRVYETSFNQVKKSGLMGSGGIGFSIGSRKQSTESDQHRSYTKESRVGSLKGTTDVFTENRYLQQGSTLTSVQGDVNIQAGQVTIKAADNRYTTNYKYSLEQKGLTVAFSAPALSALQAVQGAVKTIESIGESKHNRINAMATANALWDSARAAEKIFEAIAPTRILANGDINNSNVGISLTYGQQKNINSTHTQGSNAAIAKINAGKQLNIIAKGAEKADINIIGADIGGKQGTYLSADNHIKLRAAQQTHKERSQNKSSGFNAGVSITYGNGGMAMGITAGGNYGKGYGNADETTYAYTHIGDSHSRTQLRSGQDTRIQGAQILGKGIRIDAENLHIESLQETMSYKGKQQNISGQVTVGYGFSAGGSYNQSKINANYAAVKEQSGIYAGDEGYQVNIGRHTDLKGALITSTREAEVQNRNSFATGTLTHRDIQNYSSHNAKGFGFGGGFSVGGGSSAQNIAGTPLEHIGSNRADGSAQIEYKGVTGIFSQGNWGLAKGVLSAALGQVKQHNNESAITTSRINDKNILIRDMENQHKLSASGIEETIANLQKENRHQILTKADTEKLKSDLARDLNIAMDFIKNISDSGDKLYYKAEKNEDSSFTMGKPANCEHIDCLEFDKDNSQQLKELIYGERILTEKQAEQLSNLFTAGMLNLTRKEKVESAILYADDLNSLEHLGVILNRGSAGRWNEFLYAGFERFRAWANLPAVFGVSNATKDHAQIAKKLDEYNQYAAAKGKPTYIFHNTAHSLGVSENKNMLNWANYLKQDYKNTAISYLHAGGSYSSEEIHQQAKGVFNKVNTRYIGIEGDLVYSGIFGFLIGNNKNALPNNGIGRLQAHTVANQNINNLKFVDKSEAVEEKSNVLNKVYGNHGIRKFNYLGD
ncbi:filamentous hemagglutinin [Mesocricetibacter intestinalis]|uniref:Filamentous hemagglutinin n=1 Tax=Mesocricetibacter intestinalis TaxID=1521930 RepID=A0A4R6VEC0_9PAST|nr:hemagglutinin repeat-containing protein [Mesocricetibacter intestinalis]TDQ58951.1 filamentous hemagglutinin [Mesocricetibacter intestinalis]